MTGPTSEQERRRDAETLAGLLRFTTGQQVTPDEADAWLQRDPSDEPAE